MPSWPWSTPEPPWRAWTRTDWPRCTVRPLEATTSALKPWSQFHKPNFCHMLQKAKPCQINANIFPLGVVHEWLQGPMGRGSMILWRQHKSISFKKWQWVREDRGGQKLHDVIYGRHIWVKGSSFFGGYSCQKTYFVKLTSGRPLRRWDRHPRQQREHAPLLRRHLGPRRLHQPLAKLWRRSEQARQERKKVKFRITECLSFLVTHTFMNNWFVIHNSKNP